MIRNVGENSIIAPQFEHREKYCAKNQSAMARQNDKAAVLELGGVTGTPPKSNAIYGRPKTGSVNHNEVNRLIGETERSIDSLRELVERLIIRQEKRWGDLLSGKDILAIDDETRAIANEAIAKDGKWGVEAVSDRLVAFAIAISGNDKTKVNELKNAIEKGFKEAEKILGGQLPDISYRTYDATMKKLDDWATSED